AGRDHGAVARRDAHRRIDRNGGKEVEPGGECALIGRQRQPDGVGKPRYPHCDGIHGAAPVSAAAIRAISARATSSFVCGGQDSTPPAVTRCTLLRSPPKVPVAGETSLATIQSQPLRASLSLALATRSSVSAAKPITSRGRAALRCAMVARMSGFSTKASIGALVLVADFVPILGIAFLIF